MRCKTDCLKPNLILACSKSWILMTGNVFGSYFVFELWQPSSILTTHFRFYSSGLQRMHPYYMGWDDTHFFHLLHFLSEYKFIILLMGLLHCHMIVHHIYNGHLSKLMSCGAIFQAILICHQFLVHSISMSYFHITSSSLLDIWLSKGIDYELVI